MPLRSPSSKAIRAYKVRVMGGSFSKAYPREDRPSLNV